MQTLLPTRGNVLTGSQAMLFIAQALQQLADLLLLLLPLRPLLLTLLQPLIALLRQPVDGTFGRPMLKTAV